MRGSVTVHMAASADLIWDLVSDVTRVGEFSPETFEAEWLGGASSPEAGARFRGHVRRDGRGPVYWTVCTVAACDSGREFAFTVAGPGGKTVNTWRYQLQPAADGTDVTESFELPDTATCFYRLSADTNMRSRVAGGLSEISADAAKPGRPAALRHRDRRAGHPLHPRPLAARERAAGHHSPTGGPARSSNC